MCDIWDNDIDEKNFSILNLLISRHLYLSRFENEINWELLRNDHFRRLI